MNRRHLFTLGMAALTLPTRSSAQRSEEGRAIRLLVPTPAGGASDACARLVAGGMERALGQQVLVENRSGAGGALAARALMAAPADGHTLMWTLASMSGLPVLQKAAPYSSIAELTPLSLVGRFTYALFASKATGARKVQDLVKLLREQPERRSYATGSLGDLMATARFFKSTGTSGVRVPYQGGSQLMPDLVSGRVDFNFGPLSSGLALAKEGRIGLLAVLQAQRSGLAPDTPTLAEAGLSGVSYGPWQGLYAAPSLPAGVAQRLHHAVQSALGEARVRAGLEQQALLVEAGTPESLSAAASADAQAWREFVVEFAIAPE